MNKATLFTSRPMALTNKPTGYKEILITPTPVRAEKTTEKFTHLGKTAGSLAKRADFSQARYSQDEVTPRATYPSTSSPPYGFNTPSNQIVDTSRLFLPSTPTPTNQRTCPGQVRPEIKASARNTYNDLERN